MTMENKSASMTTHKYCQCAHGKQPKNECAHSYGARLFIRCRVLCFIHLSEPILHGGKKKLNSFWMRHVNGEQFVHIFSSFLLYIRDEICSQSFRRNWMPFHPRKKCGFTKPLVNADEKKKKMKSNVEKTKSKYIPIFAIFIFHEARGKQCVCVQVRVQCVPRRCAFQRNESVAWYL